MSIDPIGARMRDQLQSILREQIIAGELRSGARLEEVGLATKLGVSRTPLREALMALAYEGLVVSRPRRGFIVAPADPQIVVDLYPILGSLEALVVETSIEELRRDVGKLRNLTSQLGSVSKRQAASADRAFHAGLRARCRNARLLGLLASQEAMAHRLDGAMLRGMADVAGSVAQHSTILDAIERGDGAAASEAVREHWRQGARTVLEWMRQDDVA